MVIRREQRPFKTRANGILREYLFNFRGLVNALGGEGGTGVQLSLGFNPTSGQLSDCCGRLLPREAASRRVPGLSRSQVLTRRDLYDLVWSKPMTALSQEFGISDRELAKVCSRHRIPLSPPGYWVKATAGELPRALPFLELKDRSLERVRIRGATAALPDSVAELARKRKAERESRAATIKKTPDAPKSFMKTPHPVAPKAVKLLRSKKLDKEVVLSATALLN